MAMTIRTSSVLFVCAVILSGCGTIGPERGVDTHTYLLDPAMPALQSSVAHGAMVQVAAPGVRAGYDTADMVYTRRPYELEYYARNAWASPPGAMLEPMLVRALEAAGITTLVTSAGSRETRWRLDTELLELAHVHGEAGSAGRVVLWAQLTRMDRSGTVATRRLEARRPAVVAEPYAGVAAMNEALGDVLTELAEFVGATLAAHTR